MPPREFIFSSGIAYSNYPSDIYAEWLKTNPYLVKPFVPKIKKVIFNNPATIVFWADKTKTVVKCNCEEFDPEKGLAMAISKKALGNQGNYFNEIKKWVEPYEEEFNRIIEKLNCIPCMSFDTSKLKEKTEQILKDFGFKSPSVQFNNEFGVD